MPDILDSLDWKPWVQDPSWGYADIPQLVRVSVDPKTSLYWLRSLDDNGKLSGRFRIDGVERERAIAFIADLTSASKTEDYCPPLPHDHC